MKTTVLQEDLLKGLTSASRFVAPRAQLPILSNILFSAQKGKLTLGATNLETGISLAVGAKVSKEGKTTVPAKMIGELVSNIPPGKVVLEEAAGLLKISSGHFSAQLATIPANDFPEIPGGSGKPNFSLPREILDKLAVQVAFAASTDEARPALTGILLLFENQGLQAVATDGFRLSLKEFSFKKGKGGAGEKLLLPARVIEELSRIIASDEVEISLLKKEGQVLFAGDGVTLSGRLLEGEFPDYERVLPKDTTYQARTGKEELLRAVKAAAVFAREAASVVRVKVEEGQVKVSAESQQYGQEEMVVDAKTQGGELETALNYRYLLDFLASISGEEVSLETAGAASPVLFQDPKDSSYRHLIMPVRIQS